MGIKSDKASDPRTTSVKRLPLGMAVAAAILFATAGVQATSPRSEPPTATQIEKFLRAAQEQAHPRMPPAFWSAKLLEFDLKSLDRAAPSNWVVITELAFDFGPAPSGVIGFERERGGPFRLVLGREDGELRLKRFTQMRGARPLAVQ